MKKLVLLVLCLFISNCVQYPVYRSHTQKIDLRNFYALTPDTKVYYDDEEQDKKVEIFRSWFDKELVIKKEGYKDYHLKLESVWTDDKWARVNAHDAPFIFLAVPGNTLTSTFIYPPAFWICLPVAIPMDAFNLVSVPALSIWNPWKEYANENIEKKDTVDEWILNYASVILEPTDELRKSCSKKGYFISNLGCTKCSSEDSAGIVASDEELKRCPNRFKGKNNISYICTDPDPIRADTDECAKCSNRKMLDDLCMIKCPADRPLQSASGHCYSCDSQNAVYLNEKECKECPTRYFTNGRCEKCHSGVVSADGNECIHY